MSDAPIYPPPDAARGATADLCDVHLPDPVDVTLQRKVQIMDPIFRCLPGPGSLTSRRCGAHCSVCGRDFGGHLRFRGQAATVKCYENNPLVRAVSFLLLQTQPRCRAVLTGCHAGAQRAGPGQGAGG